MNSSPRPKNWNYKLKAGQVPEGYTRVLRSRFDKQGRARDFVVMLQEMDERYGQSAHGDTRVIHVCSDARYCVFGVRDDVYNAVHGGDE